MTVVITKDKTSFIFDLTRRKIVAALNAGAEEGAILYANALTEKTHPTYPDGPFEPPHSKPGEYPDRETGQGVENVTWTAATRYQKSPRSSFGVLGSRNGVGPFGNHQEAGGMHLLYLMWNHGRKGPVHIFREESSKIRRAMKEGAKSV